MFIISAYKEEKQDKIDITMTGLLKPIVDEYVTTKNDSVVYIKAALSPIYKSTKEREQPTIIHFYGSQFSLPLL